MRKLADAYGNDLRLGDYVAYSVRTSSSMYLHIGRIRSITFERNRYSVGIISTGDRWIDHSYKLAAYRTTLTANSTLLVLTAESVPATVKELIDAYDK